MAASDTLTPDTVLAMPAGATMDELVATRVLGWKRGQPGTWPWDLTSTGHGHSTNCPKVSSWPTYMGVLIDWLRERWGCVQMRVDRYDVIVWPLGGPHTTADTLPLALCRAALIEVVAGGE